MFQEVTKIFGTKVSYLMMLCELTKNECSLSSLSPVKFIFVDKFFISLTTEELFLLNQENQYVLFN